MQFVYLLNLFPDVPMLQSDTQFDICYTLNSNIRKLAIFFFLVGGGGGGRAGGDQWKLVVL